MQRYLTQSSLPSTARSDVHSPIGVHLNFCPILNPPPDSNIESALSPTESDGLKRWQKWKATGTAYAMEHGTRPSTIGFILSSNPLALLAWIGEKFLDWTDKDPDLDTILTSVSLYWLTKCAHSNLWSYRHVSHALFPFLTAEIHTRVSPIALTQKTQPIPLSSSPNPWATPISSLN
jgi:hypothetical protein